MPGDLNQMTLRAKHGTNTFPLRMHRIGGAFCGLALVLLLGADAGARAPGRAPLPMPKLVQAQAPNGEIPNGEVADGEVADGNPAELELSASSKLDAEEARERLMQQLLRAAEAGIVDLKPEETDTSEVATSDEVATSEPAPGLPPEKPDIAKAQAPDVAVAEPDVALDERPDEIPAVVAPSDPPDEVVAGSSLRPPQSEAEQPISRDAAATDENTRDTIAAAPRPPARCFSREQLTLPDIQTGDELARSIGESRKILVGEFDATDAGTGLKLAKKYLSVGMVEEARSVIVEYAPDDALSRFLLDVADAMSGDLEEVTGSLSKDECIGPQALWRAYAQARAGHPEAALRSEISSGAALEELPLLPRQIVAAELGLTAADQGEWQTVRRLEAMARRSANGFGQTLGSTHLLSYRLATWHEDPASAKQHLARALGSDPDTAVEALLIRARQALRSDDVLDQTHADLRLDLGDLARSELGTEVGHQAFELEARLFNRQASTDETIQFLSDAVDFGLLAPEDHPAFLAELVSTPAYDETSRPLALIYLEDPSRFDLALNQPSLRRSLVRSLAGEGLPRIAENLLHTGDLNDPALAVELAGGFLVGGDPRSAIATISMSPDGVPQRLVLTEAFIDLGDFDKALRTLDEIQTLGSVSDADVQRIDVLRLQAQLGSEKYDSAYDTVLRTLHASPNAGAAAQAALIALETGVEDLPQAVRTALEDAPEGELDTLERLLTLGNGATPSELNSTDELNAILQRMEDGERAIREVLENG